MTIRPFSWTLRLRYRHGERRSARRHGVGTRPAASRRTGGTGSSPVGPPGAAPQQPGRRHPQATCRAVHLQGLERVGGARGRHPAARPGPPGADPALVQPHQAHRPRPVARRPGEQDAQGGRGQQQLRAAAERLGQAAAGLDEQQVAQAAAAPAPLGVAASLGVAAVAVPPTRLSPSEAHPHHDVSPSCRVAGPYPDPATPTVHRREACRVPRAAAVSGRGRPGTRSGPRRAPPRPRARS